MTVCPHCRVSGGGDKQNFYNQLFVASGNAPERQTSFVNAVTGDDKTDTMTKNVETDIL